MRLSIIFTTVILTVLCCSCTISDNRTPGQGSPNCPICQGKGYMEKTEWLIFTSYYDCVACKSPEVQYMRNFHSSETANKSGKPCHFINYGSGTVRECSAKGECSGFSSSNREPRKCFKCGHSVDDHY